MAHLFYTPFQAFSVKWSPYPPSPDELLAVATAQHFGMTGNGRVHVLRSSDSAGLSEVAAFDAQEAVFDVAWSESSKHHFVGVCGDGSVLLWDLRAADRRPVARWSEHTQEAVCVAWSLGARRLFATASWDGTVRLYDPCGRPGAGSVAVLGWGGDGRGAAAIHAIEWHPIHAHTLAGGGAGAGVAIWDARAAGGSAPSAARLCFSGAVGDVLTLDWDRYHEHELVAGGADGGIRVWDVRRTRTPVRVCVGHELSVRRVRCSPHAAGTLASASYDFSVCLWDAGGGASGSGGLQAALLQRAAHHREFACGVDWSLFRAGLLASCGWDRAVVVWRPAAGAPPPLPGLPRRALGS